MSVTKSTIKSGLPRETPAFPPPSRPHQIPTNIAPAPPPHRSDNWKKVKSAQTSSPTDIA